MNKKEILQQTEGYARTHVPESRKPDEKYFDHVFGARRFALELAAKYGADVFVVDMAILLHDIGADAGPEHAQESAKIARGYLSSLEIPQDTKAKIVNCILKHSMGLKVETIEEQVVQDADGLIFITDTYKYFFEKQKRKFRTTEEALKRSIPKTEGMTAKIKTAAGVELSKKFLPEAIDWLNRQARS